MYKRTPAQRSALSHYLGSCELQRFRGSVRPASTLFGTTILPFYVLSLLRRSNRSAHAVMLSVPTTQNSSSPMQCSASSSIANHHAQDIPRRCIAKLKSEKIQIRLPRVAYVWTCLSCLGVKPCPVHYSGFANLQRRTWELSWSERDNNSLMRKLSFPFWNQRYHHQFELRRSSKDFNCVPMFAGMALSIEMDQL